MCLITFHGPKYFLASHLSCWESSSSASLDVPPTVCHSAATTQYPNSLNFPGVDRGLQGFGISMHGARASNDPIDDDTP
jgi:hypothetical protein